MNKVGTKDFCYNTEFWWWTAKKVKKVGFVKSNLVLNLIASEHTCVCICETAYVYTVLLS